MEDEVLGLPLTGIQQDSEAWDDEGYVQSLFPKKQPRQQGFATITPQLVADIEAAVRMPAYSNEGDTQEHIREVYASSAECPVCRQYENWDRIKLKTHIAAHGEVKAYLQAQQNAEERHRELQERHEKLRQQLAHLRGELAETDRRLEKFDSKAYVQDSRLAEKLSRALNPWAA